MARKRDSDFEDDFDNDAEPDCCELCERSGQALSFHHLIPKSVHSKNQFKRKYTREEMRTRGLMLCKLCHGGIHDLVDDNKELARTYNSREALLADPRIVKHVNWVRKQK